MLSKADIKWLSHLSNSIKIEIVPYNPKVKKVVEKLKKEILAILGKNVEVLHLGATGFGISGQGEVDLIIPISLDNFSEFIEKMEKVYGKPATFSPTNRVRFNHRVDNFNIEIVLVNQDSEGWKRNLTFDTYLKTHPEAIEAYQQLKESCDGLGIKEYYRRKMEFINDILAKALPDK